MRLRDLKPTVKRTIFLDTETRAITDAEPVGELVLLQYAVDNGPVELVGGTASEIQRAYQLFLDWLADPNTTLVAFNGFYDWSVLAQLYDYHKPDAADHDDLILAVLNACLQGRIRDADIMAHLNAIEYDWLDYDRVMQSKTLFNLAYLTARFTGVYVEGKGEDGWRLKYGELLGTPVAQWPEEARRYAHDDVVHLRNLFAKLDQNHYPDERFQTAVAWVFRCMEIWGFHTDKDRVEALEARIMPKIRAAQKRLIEAGLMKPGEAHFDYDRYEKFFLSLCKARGLTPEYTPGGKLKRTAAYLKSFNVPLLEDKAYWAYYDEPSRNMEAIRERVAKWYIEHDAAVPLTDGGESGNQQVSTDRDTLSGTNDPDLQLLADIGEFGTLRSTFLPAFQDGWINPLHPRYNPLMVTGRPSASNPNIYNIPRLPGVRECVVAREGFVFVDADFSQAELCSLAQECIDKFGFSRMAEVIKADLDLHSTFSVELIEVMNAAGACRLPVMDYDAFMKLYKNKDKDADDLRQVAKIYDFGLPGGVGEDAFTEQARVKSRGKVIIPPGTFKPAKEKWLNTFPEVRLLFEWVSAQTSYTREELAAMPPRRPGDPRPSKRFTFVQHRSNRVRGGCNYTEGCNTGFQGLTADGAKNALLKVFIACHTKGDALHGSRPVAMIYDEILLEMRRAMAGKGWKRFVQLMQDGMNEYTPDVPSKVTCEAMVHWSKNAKHREYNGELVPFDEPWELAWAAIVKHWIR